MNAPGHAALRLALSPEGLAVCRLAADAPFPAWVMHDEARFWSVTRTADELSVVCEEGSVPPSVERVERGWRSFRVVGAMALDTVGVLARLTALLAAADIPLFSISTYDTDFLLVRGTDLERAIEALGARYELDLGESADGAQ